MSKYKLKQGDTFSNWVIIDNNVYKNYRNRSAYKCKCSCGYTTYIEAASLFNSKSSKCKNCCYKGLETLSGDYFSKIRNGAVRRNIEFNISIEYIYNIFIHQDGKCALSGATIILDRSSSNRQKGAVIQTASLDRIDSSKGYIEGNVQWVHKDLNMMKQSFSQEYFIELCKKVTEHENNK